MEEIGPVEYMIVSFPGNRFTGEIAPALGKLVESNTIRIIDLAFVSKDDGRLHRSIRAQRHRRGGPARPRCARPRSDRASRRGGPDGRRRRRSSRARRQRCSSGRTSGQPSSRPPSGAQAASSSRSVASHTTSSWRRARPCCPPPTPHRRADMFRRRGGLVRAAATTAVVAGTAGAVRHRQDQKYAAQDQEAVRPADGGTAGRSGAGSPSCTGRTRLRRRARAARAAEGAGNPHRGGVRSEEEADPRNLSCRNRHPKGDLSARS